MFCQRKVYCKHIYFCRNQVHVYLKAIICVIQLHLAIFNIFDLRNAEFALSLVQQVVKSMIHLSDIVCLYFCRLYKSYEF